MLNLEENCKKHSYTCIYTTYKKPMKKKQLKCIVPKLVKFFDATK